jgi:hypothetical protein
VIAFVARFATFAIVAAFAFVAAFAIVVALAIITTFAFYEVIKLAARDFIVFHIGRLFGHRRDRFG